MGNSTSCAMNSSETVLHSFKKGWAARLEDAMHEAVTAQDASPGRIAGDLIRHGGKRIRPQLLFLCASLGEADEELLVHAAAAIELLHVGSLLHDDVMDGAATRRGAPSVNALWGNAYAATTGTHVLSCAMAELAHLPPDTVAAVAEAAFTVCSGQLRETEHVYDTELAADEHLEIIRMKTATLFGLPCRLGAELAGCDPDHVDALFRFGQQLGIAFQLTDDLLDLVGDAADLGKPTGTDLRAGVFSYAVLLALRQDPSGRLAALLRHEVLTAREAAEAARLVRLSGTVDVTRELAHAYSARAAAALAGLPEFPGHDALTDMPRRIVSRMR
ncbi:polyprenyl synthetase family protein [Streptomyces sp. HUAS TT20]|uniref:polyprenyl synthetase family protein n=1 Tax=Streptomyces sp. HUAS TT20 TaxID=3447509 RepID=UPI0021D85523|nr:polyprenyl synthetase family protein [Streptomyces sp. HUAS 15-9]UXY32433.1 polyprenyl synthetase family protein [Streptomyces sp. HUAS 15-9]